MGVGLVFGVGDFRGGVILAMGLDVGVGVGVGVGVTLGLGLAVGVGITICGVGVGLRKGRVIEGLGDGGGRTPGRTLGEVRCCFCATASMRS